MKRTKYYVLSLTLPLFLLLVVVGVGLLPAREAVAQGGTSDEIDLTKSGFYIQSQSDPLWSDWVILQSGENTKMSSCGCYLATLSSVMNYAVGSNNKYGARPYFRISLRPKPDDFEGTQQEWEQFINPYGWDESYQFTPRYLDRYLTYGPTGKHNSELPDFWGYDYKADNFGKGCGTWVHPFSLADAADPSTVIVWHPDLADYDVVYGRAGIKLNEYPGLDKERIDSELKNGMPVLVSIKFSSGPHSQVIVGKDEDGHYLINDPRQDSYGPPYVPGSDVGRVKCVPGDPNCIDSYEKWENMVIGTETVSISYGDEQLRAIVVKDDPSPFEFLTVSPDGHRTGYDPATQTQIKEDPAVSSREGGNWMDPTGEVPPGDPMKVVDILNPVDGTYRLQAIGTGDGPAKFSLSTFFDRQETSLGDVDTTITDGQLLKYEIAYSSTGENSFSEVSNFTPEARPQADSEVTAGESVAFEGSESFDVDGSVESYEWDFGDGGATASGSQASHAYEKPGEYTVTLKVTDDQGETDTSTTSVKVAPTETVAPTTTATLSSEPDADGWNNEDVTVDLKADDGEDGSEVESITYSTTGDQETSETTVEGDSAQIEVGTEGYTTVHYQARDKMGNIEEEKTLQVRLDKTGPRTAVQIPADGEKLTAASGSLGSLQTLAGTVDDPLSGVASVQVSLRREEDGRYWDGSDWVEGEQWLDTTGLGATGTSSWSRSTDLPSGDTLPEGSYTVRARATDEVGNVSESSSNTFLVEEEPDTTPTPPPDMAGTKLSDDNAILTGSCDEWDTSTVTFKASGLTSPASPYPGTFTESGTATMGELQSTGKSPLYDVEVNFTITSSAGKVTGTKTFVVGSSSGSGACVESWSGTKSLNVTARSLSYEAKIETPAGCEYVDRGTSSVQAIDSEAFNTNPFSETYTSDSNPPEPVPGSTCSADRGAPKLELPSSITEEATSKDGAEVTFTAEATDEDPTNPEVTCSPSSGSTFPLGDTTVSCSATDTAGNKAEGSFKVTVRDTTPPETSIDSGPDGPTDKNTPTFTFSGSDKVTASSNLLFSYKVDDGEWSDYSEETSAAPGGSSGLNEGSHTFYVRARDEAGNEDADPAKRSFTVEPPNRPPTADAGGSYTVKEGSSVEVEVSGADPEGGELSYAWDLDDDGSFDDSSTQTATFDASSLDGPTTRTIEAEVTDEKGAKATDKATVEVTNAPPTATLNLSSPVDEGDSFDLLLDDPSDASEADETGGFSYAFDCGNGYGDYGSENKITCSTDDSGKRTVKGTIRDKDGDTTEYTGSVDVNNLPPTISRISGPSQALTSKKVSFTAEATDPAKADADAGFSWEWAVDGGAYSSGSNPIERAFSGCGGRTVSARAKDKDGGVSESFKSGVVSAYEAHFRQPLDEGLINTVQKGRVVPVKISIGCETNYLKGLKPTIQLLKGDKTAGTENTSDEVETYSSSAADTTGVMREIGGGYIYNMQVPTKYADGTDVKAGDKFTVRVRPFGDDNKEASMYVVLEVR